MASTLSSDGGGGLNGFANVSFDGCGAGVRVFVAEGDQAVWTSELNVCNDPFTILIASLHPSTSLNTCTADVVAVDLVLVVVVDLLGTAVRAREVGAAVDGGVAVARPSSVASWDAKSGLAVDGFAIEWRIPSEAGLGGGGGAIPDDEGASEGDQGGERVELNLTTQT